MSSVDSQDTRQHLPVMVTEVIDWLHVQPTGTYFDGTIGLGGHATAILSLLSPQGKVIGTDLDEEALEITKSTFLSSSPPVSLYHSSYDRFPEILTKAGISKLNGILLDLGLSSLQLDRPDRGFAFSLTGPLDMRFDQTGAVPASQFISRISESDLADIIYKYGEERRSRAIARSIKKASAMETIDDISEAIRRSTPPAHRNRSMARVFQALRIAVNSELDKLATFLEIFVDYLETGGRIVILSYHSLEDRMVKQAFKRLQRDGLLNILTKKPLRPSESEIAANRRARPAKLRAAEKVL